MHQALPVLLLCALPAMAQHAGHAGQTAGTRGMVMHENFDSLPRGCTEISDEQQVTVRAGRRQTGREPGIIFGLDPAEVAVAPCTRLTVHFVNDDEVRHQWMVHGLPRYLYPAGMFHIEAMGGQQQSGTFIVPAADRSYLVHCDMAQHMEKGMRGQLRVGRGSGNLWAIPGLSDAYLRAAYLPRWSLAVLAATLLSVFVATLCLRRRRQMR